jgi:hypothetical protein
MGHRRNDRPGAWLQWPRCGGGGCDCVGRHDGERSAVVYSRVGVGFLVWWCLEDSAVKILTVLEVFILSQYEIHIGSQYEI